MGFFSIQQLPPDDHDLVEAAKRALSALARNTVGRRADRNPYFAAWLDVALSATDRLAQVTPPRTPPPIGHQTEIGESQSHADDPS